MRRFTTLLSLVTVLLFSFAISACPPTPRGGGGDDDDDDDDNNNNNNNDDDDSVLDDDDDSVGDDNDMSIPCSDGTLADVWIANLPGGDVTFRIDTVAAGTAFDPALDIHATLDPPFEDAALAGGDDEFDCTFPPPDYSCPSATVDGTGNVALVVMNLGSCAGATGEYRIESDPGGISLTLRHNDVEPW